MHHSCTYLNSKRFQAALCLLDKPSYIDLNKEEKQIFFNITRNYRIGSSGILVAVIEILSFTIHYMRYNNVGENMIKLGLHLKQNSASNDKCLCAFYDQPCISQAICQNLSTSAQATPKRISCKNIFICLKCPVLISNLSKNPIMARFLNALRNQFLDLQQKIDLNQMILKKQRSSLETIQKQTEGLNMEQTRQERVLKNRINRYESLLAKRDVYLHTLQKLSNIIGQISEPAKIWKTASGIMIQQILDLEAVGLLILKKGPKIQKKCYTEFFPLRLSTLIEEGVENRDYCSKLMNTDIFINLYKIYWDSNNGNKRPGPRTEEMLERCFLFSIKDYQSLTGVFIVLMKNFTSSTEELSPFFYTAARLIEEGIIVHT